VKEQYEQMKVTMVGTLKNVVDKTGGYVDPSGQWDDKSFDAGGGQEK
jgi:hypothetical protein